MPAHTHLAAQRAHPARPRLEPVERCAALAFAAAAPARRQGQAVALLAPSEVVCEGVVLWRGHRRRNERARTVPENKCAHPFIAFSLFSKQFFFFKMRVCLSLL